MSLFKDILIDAEECGIAGISENETFVFLKNKYPNIDFSNSDGIIYESYLEGRAEYLEDMKSIEVSYIK